VGQVSHNTDPLKVPPTHYLEIDEERSRRVLEQVKPTLRLY
jgi:hypothetical protein